MDYITVYDVGQSWFRHWWFPASGLVFLVIGLLMFTFRDNIRSRFGRGFAVLLPVSAAAWTLAALAIVATEYFGLAFDLRHGRCEVIEGVVMQFEPWSDVIKKDETFVVGGHRFHYSDYTITAGFNNTQVSGGPIHEGLPVRIHYSGNDIARLEIAKIQK